MLEEKSTQRIQVDISTDTLNRLERLKVKLGSTKRTQVVRDALKAYDFFAMLEDNNTIEVVDQNGNVVFHGKAILLK